MKYDIHIHLPGEGNQSKQMQEENNLPGWVGDVVKRVKMCHNWRSLHQMNKDFNRLGMAIKETVGGRRILCCLKSGKPRTESINKDYIFVGSKSKLDEEISSRTMEVIQQFVTENIGEQQLVADDNQSYTKDIALYGTPIRLYGGDEAFLEESQQIRLMGSMITEDI